MERKVLEVKGSLLATVPKSLADRLGIVKGSTVRYREVEEGLLMENVHNGKGPRLYTIGYEGRDIESFIEALRRHGIEQLADVRELPLSRKKGFSKTRLAEQLSDHGIEYRHIRELGAPKSIRDPYKSGGPFEEFAAQYRDHLEDQQLPVDALAGMSHRKTTAVMCFERDHGSCHRLFLADRLKNDGFVIEHI